MFHGEGLGANRVQCPRKWDWSEWSRSRAENTGSINATGFYFCFSCFGVGFFFFFLKLLLLHVFLLMYIWSLSSLAFLGFICFVCVSVCTKSMSFLILQLMRPSHILLSGQGCKWFLNIYIYTAHAPGGQKRMRKESGQSGSWLIINFFYLFGNLKKKVIERLPVVTS